MSVWKYTYQDELYHYGVKGMKWGVIRTAEQLGHIVKSAKSLYDSNKAKKRAKEEAAIAKKRSKITNPKKLTTEELNARIKRLQTDSTRKGKEFVSSIMESAGKNLLTQVANHYGAKGLNKIINETTTEKDDDGNIRTVLKEVVFANNKRK